MRGELEREAAGDVALAPGRRTHSALGLASGMERRFGGWRKAQLAQVVIPGGLLCWGIKGDRERERNAVRPVATS